MLQAVRTAWEAGSGHSRVATGMPAERVPDPLRAAQARRREGDDLVPAAGGLGHARRATLGCSCRSPSVGARAARRRRRSSSRLVVERVEVHPETAVVASARHGRRSVTSNLTRQTPFSGSSGTRSDASSGAWNRTRATGSPPTDATTVWGARKRVASLWSATSSSPARCSFGERSRRTGPTRCRSGRARSR